MVQQRSPVIDPSSRSPLHPKTGGVGRRQVVLGTLALGAAGALGGCGRSPDPVLRLGAMTGTVPAHLPGAFQGFVRSLAEAAAEGIGAEAVDVQVQSLGSSRAIADLFLQWKTVMAEGPRSGLPSWVPFLGVKEFAPADLMLLGDRWLSMARREQWIQTLEMDPSGMAAITDARWRAVMSETGQPGGDVWGMPYRWGTTVLVYRKDKVEEMGGPITDWSDLWRSQLRRKVVLLDQAREVIGATLKSLGGSYNTPDLEAVEGLGDRLAALHRQALLYGNTNYLQPLLLGDAWVAMGWSRDILPILPRRSQLAAVVPRSGSALWADLWVRPAATRDKLAARWPAQGTAAEDSESAMAEQKANRQVAEQLRQAWVEFCWTPDIARRVTLQTTGAAPQFLSGDWGELVKDNQGSSSDRIRFPEAKTLDQCEFLLPLRESTRQQYHDLWTQLGALG